MFLLLMLNRKIYLYDFSKIIFLKEPHALKVHSEANYQVRYTIASRAPTLPDLKIFVLSVNIIHLKR